MSTLSESVGHFEHTLYKAYDSLGCLLYVGITYDMRVRMRGHRRTARWWGEHVYMETQVYPNRTTAYSAELQIILYESPVYNVRKF